MKLGIISHILNDDGKSHAKYALVSIALSLGTAIMSFMLLIKFSLSLLTRTYATAADAVVNCLDETQPELGTEVRFIFNHVRDADPPAESVFNNLAADAINKENHAPANT